MSASFDTVERMMRQATGPVYSGATLRIAVAGQEVFAQPYGHIDSRDSAPRVTLKTRFDLASLTKPMTVGTLAMLGFTEGWLDLNEPVCEKLPEMKHGRHAEITLGELLSHRSGLPDWRPYLEWTIERHAHMEPGGEGVREKLLEWIAHEPLVRERGAEAIYSDLGYLLLGWWLERALNAPLDTLLSERIARPLDLKSTAFIPVQTWESTGAKHLVTSIASTEICPVRRRQLRGEVHDEHAFLLGGVAGHAGLFSTAADVGKWADALLASSTQAGFLPPATLDAFWSASHLAPSGTWRFAFDTPSLVGSSAGSAVSANAVGHLGFTGCSIWIDRERDATITLLSNRVHPSRENTSIRRFRPALHDAIWSALDSNR